MKYSTRWLMVVINRFLGQKVNQMTRAEVDSLVHDAGLQIVEEVNVVWMDKSLYNFIPKALWVWLDNAMRVSNFLGKAAVYKVFVCKKIMQDA